MIDFVNDCVQSAVNYFDNAARMKHTRINVPTSKIEKIQDNLFAITINQKLKYIDDLILCIESPDIDVSLYADTNERFINLNHYKIVLYNYAKRKLTIEVSDELAVFFPSLLCEDVYFVSDLKFLIKNVGKWYSKYGHLISKPNKPTISEEKIYTRPDESADQRFAVTDALTSPISYVWGAPGTGKTQRVLADCVMSYLSNGSQILIVAPTNNAIEQTLRAVISALEEAGQSISPILRLGVASNDFARKYGDICERVDLQGRTEELKSEIELLQEQIELQERAECFLNNFSGFHKLKPRYLKLKTDIDGISEKILVLTDERIRAEAECEKLSQSISKTREDLNTVYSRRMTIGYKFKALFSDSEKKSLDNYENNLLEQKSDLEEKSASATALLNNIKSKLAELEDKKYIWVKECKEISTQISKLCNVTIINIDSIETAEKKFNEDYEKYKSITIKKDLPELLAIKMEELELLQKTRAKEAKGKMVFACTVDYLYAHFSSLGDNGLSSSLLSHVFLDEAAYCPMIKAGILFSFGRPVTFLGDHMQLPPICEASEQIVNDREQKVFLWDWSAIYFAHIFNSSYDLDVLFDIFKSHTLPPEYIQSIAVLPYTYRFGDNLAKILDEFVYHTGFSGRRDFDTEIIAIDAPKHRAEDEKRTSLSECDAIASFIKSNKPESFVVMAPYNAQRKLLAEKLKGLADMDDILTIHASQGREWDTVILSVTDTEDKYLTNSDIVPDGLFTLNTAISRAKKNIVIVCDCNYWRKLASSQLIGRMISIATKRINR